MKILHLYFSCSGLGDQYGLLLLLVPVDSPECNAALMSLRAQTEHTHPEKSERAQWGCGRKSKINPAQEEN